MDAEKIISDKVCMQIWATWCESSPDISQDIPTSLIVIHQYLIQTVDRTDASHLWLMAKLWVAKWLQLTTYMKIAKYRYVSCMLEHPWWNQLLGTYIVQLTMFVNTHIRGWCQKVVFILRPHPNFTTVFLCRSVNNDHREHISVVKGRRPHALVIRWCSHTMPVYCIDWLLNPCLNYCILLRQKLTEYTMVFLIDYTMDLGTTNLWVVW